jgi:ubiquinone/menaquinone biosynthesis C-methylase UbiE
VKTQPVAQPFSPRSSQLEAHLVQRYRRWQSWDRFAYKHIKGARLVAILEETGGAARRGLEIGVGPGGVASVVSGSVGRLVGLDLSPDALVTASAHCAGLPVSLVRASGFVLPFATSSLDLVYCSQVLHLFTNATRFALMREVARVLRPDGRFVFDMKNRVAHPLQYLRASSRKRAIVYPTPVEVLTLLEASGFGEVRVFPGLLPRCRWIRVPNVALFRRLAHTRFYVARPAALRR